jgi:hypothetical protein
MGKVIIIMIITPPLLATVSLGADEKFMAAVEICVHILCRNYAHVEIPAGNSWSNSSNILGPPPWGIEPTSVHCSDHLATELDKLKKVYGFIQ